MQRMMCTIRSAAAAKVGLSSSLLLCLHCYITKIWEYYGVMVGSDFQNSAMAGWLLLHMSRWLRRSIPNMILSFGNTIVFFITTWWPTQHRSGLPGSTYLERSGTTFDIIIIKSSSSIKSTREHIWIKPCHKLILMGLRWYALNDPPPFHNTNTTQPMNCRHET